MSTTYETATRVVRKWGGFFLLVCFRERAPPEYSNKNLTSPACVGGEPRQTFTYFLLTANLDVKALELLIEIMQQEYK
jgi:hypothetical protein